MTDERSSATPAPLTYAEAGVDIDAADRAVDAMRDLVASTAGRPGVLGAIGGFGGMFEVPTGYRRPVLVSSTDGVGTKMAVAMATGRFGTVGIDLVAMCVDDLVCSGASPLFFLDYQLLGKVDPAQVRELMTGIAAGCRTAGAAIVGGELAEHPGLLAPGEVDMAGFAVGIVEHDRIIDGPARCRAGDALLALPSPGLRSNGYSLARRALLDTAGRPLDGPAWDGASTTLADELLRPSVIYAPAVTGLLADPGPGSDAAPAAAGPAPDGPGGEGASPVRVHAIAHITGGGLPGNLPRVLPSHLDAVVDPARWERPRIFREIQAAGSVSETEMRRVFNLGVGMVIVLPADDVPDAIDILAGLGQEPLVIGHLAEGGSGQVRFKD
ncbi:phosphoribosylformylglycinamidine cyclo-ligase [Acidiferrimicrobium sp. IK]|uniref:phosphoribosylformylglycinamidine cyclo-ligase n=1 Tax=Acidiferrimicrobium sp. IK TaxID=2871700 RepID=UPI0021CB3AA0|nr:phosphoribosylformylglycinamidine cyclo-ligase [Acidiferrimicrobium sp. IK]